VITTRDYQDRLDTLERVRAAGMHVCCGASWAWANRGTSGPASSRSWRASIRRRVGAVNQLVQVEGTPLAGTEALPWTEFVRTIAVARILMPGSFVRLSAGRTQMHEAVQALCFLAGANSIFYARSSSRRETRRRAGRRALRRARPHGRLRWA